VEGVQSGAREVSHEAIGFHKFECDSDSSGEAAGGEDVLRVEGSFEAAHQGDAGDLISVRVRGGPAGSRRYGMRSPHVDFLLQSERGVKQSGVASIPGIRSASSGNGVEDAGHAMCQETDRFFICGGGEQSEIDGAAGAGD